VTLNRTRRASYLEAAPNGRLDEVASRLETTLRECTVCPRACGVDRRRELGWCGTGIDPVVASWGPHHGEEPEISGRLGSGTVFLAGCNLACVFCQNHTVSRRPANLAGHTMTIQELASVFLELQGMGCHNLNWVSPTHQLPQLVRALAIAAGRGCSLPVVYNSNGYDEAAVLQLLDGIVDVYMPDLKYADADVGDDLSDAPYYPQRTRAALTEMFRQVGADPVFGPFGTFSRALLVRILVLPGNLAGLEENLRWIADTLSPRVQISLLAQYWPAHRVAEIRSHPELRRRVTADEWREATNLVHRIMIGDYLP